MPQHSTRAQAARRNDKKSCTVHTKIRRNEKQVMPSAILASFFIVFFWSYLKMRKHCRRMNLFLSLHYANVACVQRDDEKRNERKHWRKRRKKNLFVCIFSAHEKTVPEASSIWNDIFVRMWTRISFREKKTKQNRNFLIDLRCLILLFVLKCAHSGIGRVSKNETILIEAYIRRCNSRLQNALAFVSVPQNKTFYFFLKLLLKTESRVN